MTHKQKEFVTQYLKHRCKITAHNIAYGENPNFDSVESAANRLLRIPEIADTIRSIQDGIRHEVEEEFNAKYREELLTIYDKRLLLKKIANGEIYIEQKYKGKNCTQCSQYITSNINQMLAGIREDSKTAGHYPYKQNGKWVIPAQQAQLEQENITSPSGVGGKLTPQENNPEKDPSDRGIRAGNKRQQIEENIIDNTSPPEAEDGGKHLPQENNPEKDNLPTGRQATGQQLVSPPEAEERGTSREQPAQEKNSPRKDNKRQQKKENVMDNITNHQSDEIKTPGAITIISQEKLRELLYPKKPKLSYMKNNP